MTDKTAQLNAADSFDQEGHLGAASRTIRKTIRDRWKTEFGLAERANRLAHKMRKKAHVDGDSVADVVSFSLLVRVIDDFQSVVILCREGFTVQAGVVLRSMLEGTALLRNLSEDNSFLHQYIGSDLLNRLKLIRDVQKDKSGALDSLKSDALLAIQKALEEIQKTEGIKQWKKRELFEAGGLGFLYQTSYRMLSEDIHVDARTLQRYLEFSDGGDITATDATPKTEDTEGVLVLAIMFLMIALDAAASLLSLDQFAPEIESVNKYAGSWAKRREER